MTTPVAIIFFNRLEPLKRLVARLAEVKPPKVYLVADGARPSRPDDVANVAACRAFMQELPWKCEIKTNFAEKNLGCRERVTSGLDWVFENEPEAIILEDDCIPEVTFFPWVETMLARYREVPEVMSVGGTNMRPQLSPRGVDAVFTKYAMIWGWATWARAWRLNDKNLTKFPAACQTHLIKHWLGKWRAEVYWRYLLTHIKTTWDYCWLFAHFTESGLCVVPPVCLVENIGMSGVEATHTSDNTYDLPSVARNWSPKGLREPKIAANVALDGWMEDNIYSRSLGGRLKWLWRKLRKQVTR